MTLCPSRTRFSGTNSIKNQWLAVLFVLIPGISIAAPSTSKRDLEDERWFEIELIVFAHKNKEALESEDWPEITDLTLPGELVELSLPAPEPVAEPEEESVSTEPALIFEPVKPASGADAGTEQTEILIEPVPMPVAFEMLKEEELQLKEVIKKLTRSPEFEPLLHVAWRQPTYDKKHAQTVLLYEGMTEPVPEETVSPETGEADSSANLDNTLPAPDPLQTSQVQTPQPVEQEIGSVNQLNPRFVGTVRMSVARYLHVAADLVYRTPITQQAAISVPDLELWYDRPYPTLSEHQGPAVKLEEWSAIRGYRLKESRRMRSRKLHYLDHPFFGVIVTITPVELPTDPEKLVPLDPTKNISSPKS